MKNPQIAIVNSTIRASGDSVKLTRLLASHYEMLEAEERHQFVTALIMEVGACSALMKAQKESRAADVDGQTAVLSPVD